VAVTPLSEIAGANWPGIELREQLREGNRNEVWRATLRGRTVAVRRSRRSSASLAWELDLIGFLAEQGFRVPEVVPGAGGEPSIDGVVVQRWLDGVAPTEPTDWKAVASELVRLHQVTADFRQRPGCCSVDELETMRRSVDADLDAMPADQASTVVAVFRRFAGHDRAVIHGDPGPSNIRIAADGRVGLLDWDESRVDVTWHDLSNLGTLVLDELDHRQAARLSDAWEAANGWIAEPDYARRRLANLDRGLSGRVPGNQ
jgi:Ser/Thr protein kinase RdoA (MazF antagonist)